MVGSWCRQTRQRTRIVPRAAAAIRSPAARPGSVHHPRPALRAPAPSAHARQINRRRLLDVDIPAPARRAGRSCRCCSPRTRSTCNAASLLISSDMALAAAVLKAVNSAMYGLRGRVQSVQQAITYLGTREVASVTFEMGCARGLSAPRPSSRPRCGNGARARPADGPDRRHARRRRLGRALGRACSRRCGKAVHVPPRHRALQASRSRKRSDEELLMLEHAKFGVSHDTLGAALCESWGVAPAGGRQRALSRHRQQHAGAADARRRGARCARSRRSRMR